MDDQLPGETRLDLLNRRLKHLKFSAPLRERVASLADVGVGRHLVKTESIVERARELVAAVDAWSGFASNAEAREHLREAARRLSVLLR